MSQGSELVQLVKRNVKNAFNDENAFEMLYIGKKDACIPDELLSDDVNQDIHAKYYWLLDPIRAEIENKYKLQDPIYIYVDTSLQDESYAIMTLDDKYVLHILSEKSWNLCWDSQEEMGKELEDIYNQIDSKLQKIKLIESYKIW